MTSVTINAPDRLGPLVWSKPTVVSELGSGADKLTESTWHAVPGPLSRTKVGAMLGPLGGPLTGYVASWTNPRDRVIATDGLVELGEARQRLHDLAGAHGIDGVSLGADDAGFRAVGELGIGGSTAMTARVGERNLEAIANAARDVIARLPVR